MRGRWHFRFVLLLACPVLLHAQEVKYVDLSLAPQRTQLRHPPAPPCKDGVCGGYGSVGVGDGAPDKRDPHALGVYLLRVNPTEIDPAQPFEAELRVLNTGLAPIDIPVSPHLSDLQPADESTPFSYFSLTLVVSMEGDSQHPAFALAELYGAKEHDGTVLALRPGEWIQVKAKMQPRYSPREFATVRLSGGFWLRSNRFNPHDGGDFTMMENLYPNVTPTPSLTVRVLAQPDRAKRFRTQGSAKQQKKLR
jgi:hypothetical protein